MEKVRKCLASKLGQLENELTAGPVVICVFMYVQDLKHRKIWGESGKGPCLRNVVLLASEIAFCVDSMENDYKNKYCKTLNEMGNWQC